jgi:hypothetical protein
VFINEIVRLHGIPKKIISDRGSIFMGIFWMSFQEALGTQLNFGRRLQPPSFLGYNLKEAPTPQFSGYNQKEATTPYVLQLQPPVLAPSNHPEVEVE